MTFPKEGSPGPKEGSKGNCQGREKRKRRKEKERGRGRGTGRGERLGLVWAFITLKLTPSDKLPPIRLLS